MITVTRKHSLGLAGARKNVQSWLDYNYLWEPRVRLNRMRYEWTAQNQLKLSGKVGQSGYAFDATMLIEPDKITVTASNPPTVYVGASAGWDDEIKKILGLPGTLPVRTVIELAHDWDPKALLGRLDRWVTFVSGGNRRWVDATGATTIKPTVAQTVDNIAGAGEKPPVYKGFFFYQMTDKTTGQPRQSPAYWGQGEVYGILTIMPGKVTLEIPQGAEAGREGRAKSWEAMLGGQLAELVGTEPGVFAGSGAGLKAKLKAGAKKVAAVVTATPGSLAQAAAEAKTIATWSKQLALALAGTYPALVSKIPPTALEQWFVKLATNWGKELGSSVVQIQAMPTSGKVVVFQAFYKPKTGKFPVQRTYSIPVLGADQITSWFYWKVTAKGVVKDVPLKQQVEAKGKVTTTPLALPPAKTQAPASGGGSGLAIGLGVAVLGAVLVLKKKRR